MREMGLIAIRPRRFRPVTTDSKHRQLASPNLLKGLKKDGFTQGEDVVDVITYIRLSGRKFCYLAMFQDKKARRIIGWEIAKEMTAELAVSALRKALRQGLIRRNAVVHIDEGSEYVSKKFRKLLKRCGLRQSMSRKGNCCDNAQAENFFSRLKTELNEEGIFETFSTVRDETFA